MANTLAPFGFSQIGVLDGISPTFGNSIRSILKTNSTPIFHNDPVTMSSGYVVQSTAGTTQIDGIFIGCKYLSVATGQPTWSQMWPGSDAQSDAEAYIIAAGTSTFFVQANGQLLKSHEGKNANFALGTGNTATKQSGATLDVSTIATTNTLPFRIVSLVGSTPPGLTSGQNGSDLTTPYSWAVVTFNNQDFKSLTGI